VHWRKKLTTYWSTSAPSLLVCLPACLPEELVFLAQNSVVFQNKMSVHILQKADAARNLSLLLNMYIKYNYYNKYNIKYFILCI
jgi:hypothetical protein